jgi:hypothetical protein
MSELIRTRYDRLAGIRENRIDIARRCASLTIPSLFPEEGVNDTTEIPLTYDSTSARGVSSLAAKITDAVFPPNARSLFEITVDQTKVPPGTDTSADQQVLNRLCRLVSDRLYNTNLRTIFTDSNEMMLVGGQDLIWYHDDFTFSNHSLEDFVVRRLPNGKVVHVILREWLDPDALPDEWGSIPKGQGSGIEEACYTECVLRDGVWYATKEFRDATVDSGEYEYQPFVVNGWRRIPKQHYCRSFVEENEGDIRMAEVLGKSLKECSVIASKLLMGVDPGGITEIRDIEQTENGQFIGARQGEIFPIQAAAPAQMQTIQQALGLYRRDIGKTFLDPGSIQRNGDRVTATEWTAMLRQMAGTLGPNFSNKADEVQIPIIRRTIALMVDRKEIPKDVLKNIEPGKLLQLQVRTGLTILKQEIEEGELAEFATLVAQLPPVQGEVKWDGWLNRFVTAKRWDTVGIVKTEEDKKAEAEQAMRMQVAQQGIASAGRMAENAARQ